MTVPVYKQCLCAWSCPCKGALSMYQCSMQYLASAAFALRIAACSNSAAASSTLCPEAAFSSGETGLLMSLTAFPVSMSEAAGGETGPLASDVAACNSGLCNLPAGTKARMPATTLQWLHARPVTDGTYAAGCNHAMERMSRMVDMLQAAMTSLTQGKSKSQP